MATNKSLALALVRTTKALSSCLRHWLEGWTWTPAPQSVRSWCSQGPMGWMRARRPYAGLACGGQVPGGAVAPMPSRPLKPCQAALPWGLIVPACTQLRWPCLLTCACPRVCPWHPPGLPVQGWSAALPFSGPQWAPSSQWSVAEQTKARPGPGQGAGASAMTSVWPRKASGESLTRQRPGLSRRAIR